MNKGINLAATTGQPVVKETPQALLTVRYIAIGVLFIVAALSVIFFILIATSPLQQLKHDKYVAIQKLGRYHQDIAKLLILEERADSIKTILASRPSITMINQDLQKRLPDTVSIKTLSIKGKKITITATSPSLTQVNTFMNNLIDGTKQKKISKVAVQDLSVEEAHGQFLIILEVAYL